MNLNWIWKSAVLLLTFGSCGNRSAYGNEEFNSYKLSCNKINWTAGLTSFRGKPNYEKRSDFLDCAPEGMPSTIDCGWFRQLLNSCKVEEMGLRRTAFDNECAEEMVYRGYKAKEETRNGREKSLKHIQNDHPCAIKYRNQ